MPSRYIHGMHGQGAEHLMADRPGWVGFLHETGHDKNDMESFDYRPWNDRGFGTIALIRHGYEPNGSIPEHQHYPAFAKRLQNFVRGIKGKVDVIEIGNETNLSRERPHGQVITPAMYAECFNLCHAMIKAVPGYADQQVAPAPVGPWNTESGDWIAYWKKVLELTKPTALTIHAYIHGYNAGDVFSDAKMGNPAGRYWQFWTYRDTMGAIPERLRGLPVYMTEMCSVPADDKAPGWLDANSGLIKNFYRELNGWNKSGKQQILAALPYRWEFDKWAISTRSQVQRDFQEAVAMGYTSTPADDCTAKLAECRAALIATNAQLGKYQQAIAGIQAIIDGLKGPDHA